MIHKAAGWAVVLILLSTFLVTAASATDFLEIAIDKYYASATFALYDVSLTANKDGAASCELVTPNGAYLCTDVGGEFRPEQGYFDAHRGMSFSELTAAISGVWTLTWDAGPTQTVAIIDLGTIVNDDFLPVPTLISPIDGVPILIPGDPNPPTIEWTYGPTAPCDAQRDAVEAFFGDQSGVVVGSGELSCADTSWSPGFPLEEGSWSFAIHNSIPSYRQVPDGITIGEGEWPLENEDWLALRSIAISRNDIVPTESTSWGAIKAQYR